MEIPQSKLPLDVSECHLISTRDALDALTAINQDVIRLSYGDVLIRRDYQRLKSVRLLAGGVAGTDLSQAMFVGKGMLTAAIFGNENVPTSRQILHTIKELNQGENCGILVIVQNNADLLNFGLAVERANADCQTRVRLLVVDDDRSYTRERYSCGYILLSKILGAMAEQGAFFEDIYRFYQNIVNHITTVPLNYEKEKISFHQISIIMNDFKSTVQSVIERKSQHAANLQSTVPIVALINTSKNMSRLAELGLIRQVIEGFKQMGVSVMRVYYGSFVTVAHNTALLTSMKIFDMKIIQYLDANCEAPGWVHLYQFRPEISMDNEFPGILIHEGKSPIQLKGPRLSEFQCNILVKAVQFAADALISCERQLNIIDKERSNGDVGTRLKKMADNVNKRLKNQKLPVDCPFAFLKKMSVIAESAIGGTMGTIYGLLFERGANVFEALPETQTIEPFMWANVLSVGCNSVERCCSGENRNGTLYYALKCCEVAVQREIEKGENYLNCYGVGVSAAEEAAQKTRGPTYKHPDAGAHGVGIWMRAIYEGVKLMCDMAD